MFYPGMCLMWGRVFWGLALGGGGCALAFGSVGGLGDLMVGGIVGLVSCLVPLYVGCCGVCWWDQGLKDGRGGGWIRLVLWG